MAVTVQSRQVSIKTPRKVRGVLHVMLSFWFLRTVIYVNQSGAARLWPWWDFRGRMLLSGYLDPCEVPFVNSAS